MIRGYSTTPPGGMGGPGRGTGISEAAASKIVPFFSFATQGGKQVSFHFRQRNSGWVQAREAQIRLSGFLQADLSLIV